MREGRNIWKCNHRWIWG